MKTLGEKIAIERLTKRWTQKKLASSIGITQSMLSEYENDIVSPRWDKIVLIARQLEIPIYKLLPLEEEISRVMS